MNSTERAQALAIYKTTTAIQTSVLTKHAPTNMGLTCVAKDLTLPQMSTLVVIRDREPMTVKDLAGAMRVSSPSASAMVDRLFDFGVLTREPSQVDRREVCIRLTEEGVGVITAMEGQLLESIGQLLMKLGPEIADKWCEVCEHIDEVLSNETDKSDETLGKEAERGSSVA